MAVCCHWHGSPVQLARRSGAAGFNFELCFVVLLFSTGLRAQETELRAIEKNESTTSGKTRDPPATKLAASLKISKLLAVRPFSSRDRRGTRRDRAAERAHHAPAADADPARALQKAHLWHSTVGVGAPCQVSSFKSDPPRRTHGRVDDWPARFIRFSCLRARPRARSRGPKNETFLFFLGRSL